MIKLIKNIKGIEWLFALVAMGLVVFNSWLDMEIIKCTGSLVGLITSGTATTQGLWQIAGKMIGLAVGAFGVNFVSNVVASYTSTHIAKRLRREMFAKVNSFSMEEINRFSTASLITRSTNDITQISQTLFMAMRMAVRAPSMAVFSLINVVNVNLTLSWVTAVALAIMFALLIVMYFVVVPKFTEIQQKTDRINLVTRENITGLRVVRAYNAEQIELDKFENANDDLTKTRLFVSRTTAIMSPSMNLIMNGMYIAIFWIGAYLVGKNIVGYQDLTVFTQYSMHILMSFMIISILFIMLPRGATSAKRITEILSTQNKIVDGVVESTERLGKIEFKNVSFAYPGSEECLLKNINLTIKKGETVAFIGSTGSGKSTLINLIPRFYDVTDGEIIIDGVNVKDYKLATLYEKLGFVPQKALLFKGTIKENILYGKRDATDEEIAKALDIAQANFVYDLESGLEYQLAQGGYNVSGGQRQRLSIARAIVGNPEFYIFDDSFSALDYKTDRALREKLKTVTQDSTTLIVAQRIGTIMDADKIVVLDKGEIVGLGKHKELLKNCKVYKEIALSQLSKEELE
ncbi:MAG: ABC transporter ATP-binding protein [Clostridia bacterium]|nr:ABC transporter ATP-binding protein [Clostridia bacterium]